MTTRVHSRSAPVRSPGLLIAAVIACAAAAMALTLAATRLGAGATPDTGHYLRVADNLLAGRGFVRLGPEVMASWPPLYPLLLAAGQQLGAEALAWARLLNALLFAACAALAVVWVHARTSSVGAACAAGAAIALGPPLVYVSSLALTEMLFITLQLATLFALDGWMERPTGRRLAGCAAALTLACLTRYQGLALLAAVGGLILAIGPGTWARRLRSAAAAATPAVVALGLWIARNVSLTGNPLGPRFASEYVLADAAADLGQQTMSWVLPWRVLLVHPMAGMVLLLLLLGICALIAVRHPGGAGRLVFIAAAYTATFVVFMLRAATQTSMDPLADRILSPLFPCLVLMVVGAASLALHGVPPSFRGASRVAAAAATLAALGLLSTRTLPQVREAWAEGPGGASHSNFNTAKWRSSPTLLWAARLKGEMVFASTPAALYLASGVDARPMPRKHARRAPGVPMDRLEDLQRDVRAAGHAWLVISHEHVPSHTFTTEELSSAFVVQPVARLPDGEVFRMQARQ